MPPTKPPVEELCIDVMSSVCRKPAEIREDIENNTLRIMRNLRREITTHKDKRAKNLCKIIKSLRERNLIISKADKSNNVMVMDASYYERVVNKIISSGPYEEICYDLLKEMVDEVKQRFGKT